MKFAVPVNFTTDPVELGKLKFEPICVVDEIDTESPVPDNVVV